MQCIFGIPDYIIIPVSSKSNPISTDFLNIYMLVFANENSSEF